MVAKKSKSKRITLRQKYKVQKKVKEHHRRLKKLAKKNPNKLHKGKPELTIPNSWPFKSEMVSQIEKAREEEEALKKKKREEAKKRKKAEKEAAAKNAGSSLSTESVLPPSISTAARKAVPKQPTVNPIAVRNRQTLQILHTVIPTCGLLLYVLDARDPLGSRSLPLERRIAALPKSIPIIFVLAHADRVPAAVVAAWVRFLSVSHPTVAFYHNNKINDSTSRDIVHRLNEVCPGVRSLLDLIAKFQPSAASAGSSDASQKEPLKVGVIGFTKTGKSTLVNNLCRSYRVSVGNFGNHTKDVSSTRLSPGVFLLDTPAIPSMRSHPGPHNTLPIERARRTLLMLVAALPEEVVVRVFRIPRYSTPEEFMQLITVKRGQLRKGGVLDPDSAARAIMRDWNEGKLPYYTHPPANTPASIDHSADPTGLSALFDMANAETIMWLQAHPAKSIDEYVVLDDSLLTSTPNADEEEEGEEGDVDMDGGDEEEDEEDDDEDDDDEEEKDDDDEAYEDEEEDEDMSDMKMKDASKSAKPASKAIAPPTTTTKSDKSKAKKGATAATSTSTTVPTMIVEPAAPAPTSQPIITINAPSTPQSSSSSASSSISASVKAGRAGGKLSRAPPSLRITLDPGVNRKEADGTSAMSPPAIDVALSPVRTSPRIQALAVRQIVEGTGGVDLLSQRALSPHCLSPRVGSASRR